VNDNNLTWHATDVTKELRRAKNGHSSFVIWLTGLSGSGKSTIADALEGMLFKAGIHTYVLDGDNVRMGLNANLGFTEQDRQENIRRVAEVSRLFVDAGVVVIAAVISPFAEDRQRARARFEPTEFVEVFVDCPVDECIKRDPKGLFQRALAGQIQNFTGVSAPYEKPQQADVTVHTNKQSIADSVETILNHLVQQQLIPAL
jgi:adenylylsulfate kinase